MKLKQKFTIEDVIGWFERARVSDLYSRLYCLTHVIGAETGYDYFLGNAALRLEQKVIGLWRDRGLDSEGINDFEFFLVGGLQYDKAVSQIRERLGDVPEPYIYEHMLLGDIRRRMDYILMLANGALQECPAEIKDKFHNDKRTILAFDLEQMIGWLRKNSERDNIPKDGKFQEAYKDIIRKLATSIGSLLDFYTQNREGPIERPESREELVTYLNKLFSPKSKFSYRDIDIG